MDAPITGRTADTGLTVTFYTEQVPDNLASAATGTLAFKDEERVRISPVGNVRSEFVGRAHDVSHPDPDTGRDVTYAMRFPQQYAAFKSGAAENQADLIAQLEAKLAAARAASTDTTKAQLEQARKAAEAAKAEKDGEAVRRTQRQADIAEAARATVQAANEAQANADAEMFAEAAKASRK